jgi:asparagine synthetase B (glutamine-hydrolysing)
MPGHLAELDAERHVIARAYWSLAEVAERGLSDPLSASPRELADQLEERLRATIREQMVADVPLGALLSGGVDSTSVVALMQAESNRAVRTFTIGFREPDYNEAEHAMAVARHLGTEHTELYVSPDEARLVIPRLPTLYDEPFADSSQVPTFLVSQMARRDVTVALTGDGADELFGGYSRINEYDSQKSDTFEELSFYHLPRLDKMSMAHTLELRNPFLHLDIVRFALHLPLEWRTNKKILKDTFSPLLPDEIVNRKKEALKNPQIKEDKLAYRQKAINIFLENDN